MRQRLVKSRRDRHKFMVQVLQEDEKKKEEGEMATREERGEMKK